MTPSSQLDIRVVFSLQYRSYLCPTDRWHYGSVDYLDPLLLLCQPEQFNAQGGKFPVALCRHIILRLVTPPREMHVHLDG